MSKIRCNQCGWLSNYTLGSADELRFMRVIDASLSDEEHAHPSGRKFAPRPHKLFFCSAECYLNRIFVQHAARRAGLDLRFEEDRHAPELDESIQNLQPEYDDIVRTARESHGLQTFLQRMGIFHPPQIVIVDEAWADQEEVVV